MLTNWRCWIRNLQYKLSILSVFVSIKLFNTNIAGRNDFTVVILIERDVIIRALVASTTKLSAKIFTLFVGEVVVVP